MLRYYTVEYDGYTPKKEEENEEARHPAGSRYLLEMLALTEEEKEEMKRVIEKASKKSRWKDLSEKQERIYGKMESIVNNLKSYTPYSTPFLTRVNKREAPEYYNMILHPMDLSKIARKIASQEYAETSEFVSDIALIWQNCFEYNNTQGNIYAQYAQKMKERTQVLLHDLNTEKEVEIEGTDEERSHFVKTGKVRKDMAVERSSLLQRPEEFARRRNSQRMGKYWEREQILAWAAKEASLENEQTLEEILKKNTADRGLAASPGRKTEEEHVYLPEYEYFYDSFPCGGAGEPETEYFHLDVMVEEVLRQREKKHREAQAQRINREREGRGSEYEVEKKLQEIQQTLAEQIDRDRKKEEEGGIDKRMSEDKKIQLTQTDLALVLKKVASVVLLGVGFTSAEHSALNILVGYTLSALDKVLVCAKEGLRGAEDVPEEKRGAAAAKEVVHRYRVKTAELHPVRFFTESEEEAEEETDEDLLGILDLDTEDGV